MIFCMNCGEELDVHRAESEVGELIRTVSMTGAQSSFGTLIVVQIF